MALDTQTFGITRHWLSVALDCIQRSPDIFSKRQLNYARKLFLAGTNQLDAIKSWLTCAGIINVSKGSTSLTELGKLIAALDPRAECAWTWWLFHLHLCINTDSFPYSTFFLFYDSDGRNWMAPEDVRDTLSKELESHGITPAPASLKSYFEGVDKSLCPGSPLYNLGLVERRLIPDRANNRTTLGIRKSISKPSVVVVTYATLLFHSCFFPDKQTVETKILLEKGLAKSLGITNWGLREALTRIHQDRELSIFLKYSQVANIDSVQFPSINISRVRKHGYSSGEIVWT